MVVESDEHLLDLLEELFGRGWIAESVKENGIALQLGYLEPDVIGLQKLFQQLFDDVAAVRNLRGLDKSREAADIRYEQKSRLGGVVGLHRHKELSLQ